MTVYVDDMRRKQRVGKSFGSWSHLFADTQRELLDFADRLGLHESWIQHPDTHRVHFDLIENKRIKALQMGAVPISYPRGTAELLARKKAGA